ncbi:hypothetical protein C900_02887 [Fulvivirga imtechensis AK7]|uniref:Uncharacterized protein n=1 Tax=Fulvivirga imtechensis AK7 TaxID=1237149 RepID=L8JVM6_9BACT|nr:NfeD family protein [Fulvivirga imtechensis]ELR71272.1 hypothetical protein C900_02887 [Fulvivirga imtechensis AK7]
MGEWFTAIILIVAGLALIVIEIIFVPGTTIVGILGLIATIFGIYLSFVYFGSEVGWWMAAGTAILFGVALYYSFRKNAWDRFSLKDTIQSKVNEGRNSMLQIGDEGIAMSTLRPFGKAEFEQGEFEVRSIGNYIDSGTKVKIIKISNNSIFVEPIN